MFPLNEEDLRSKPLHRKVSPHRRHRPSAAPDPYQSGVEGLAPSPCETDIAGIVSTIYESIGKSVTVPHYGSKTIQVRLTVVPDDGSSRKEARHARRQRRGAAAAPVPSADCGDASDDERRSRLSLEQEDDASSCSSEHHRIAPPPPPVHPLRPARHVRREPRPRKHTKKRSGSLQRRELLEIIQANMEKNHLSFQTTRKPYERVVNEEEITSKYQKLRNRAYTISEKPTTNTFHKAKTECSVDGYLDLAAERGGDSNLCRYDRYLHAVICSSARHATTGYHQRQPRVPRPRAHARSRSHDVPAGPAAPPQLSPHSPRSHLTPSSHPRVLQIIFL
ncbi:Protein naked cuticle homolog [Eumeta japonica]|uniref:Protein naked cuticle homolog n=1 Tax=Eumeta variegata TaxID=151549 RepID=A0A4C2A1H7_EUMVA|nr:Protein naked cuticle homolog [Eumeta japonica]